MSTVVSIALNPSIDKSTAIFTLVPEKKMYCSKPELHPGGGGINVARGLVRLGTPVTCIFPVGGYHGSLLKEMMEMEKVPSIPVHTKENTRENWIVQDKGNCKQYHFVMPGSVITNEEWDECINRLTSIEDVEYIVLSGSMPAEFPESIFESLCNIAYQKKARLIVDTKGEGLKKALDNGVYLIKPNHGEFLALIDLYNLKHKDLKGAAQELVGMGLCDAIVISLGANGAILVTEDIYEEIRIPSVNVHSVVGAGDSMVAGIVHGLVQRRSLKESVAFGLACGSATTLNEGAELFQLADVESLYNEIQTSEIEIITHIM
jgi:6-phosphofructokinase 2